MTGAPELSYALLGRAAELRLLESDPWIPSEVVKITKGRTSVWLRWGDTDALAMRRDEYGKLWRLVDTAVAK